MHVAKERIFLEYETVNKLSVLDIDSKQKLIPGNGTNSMKDSISVQS